MREIFFNVLFLCYIICCLYVLGLTIISPFLFTWLERWQLALLYFSAIIITASANKIISWLTKKMYK